jgi:sugar lactone lactonase YvrE
MTLSRFGFLASLVAAVIVALPAGASAQSGQASNDLPNPYTTVTGWAHLPDGRKWGSTAGVDIGPDGSLWAIDRCGGNSCATSPLDPVIHFDANGNAIAHFGANLFVQPHGLYVDPDGNVWVTDPQGANGKGYTVVKFSSTGQVLLTLGKPGVQGNPPEALGAPSDVITAPNGDIIVADGHSGCNCENRLVVYDKTGKFVRIVGKTGSGPGEFDGPHALDYDSQGRLFVGDRTNNRVEILDRNLNFVAEWKQFGRPSGLFIDANDNLYVADSESREEEGYGHDPGVHRGMRIGSAKTGQVVAFIPDPDPKGASSAAEGVAVDRQGNIYGAEVGPRDLKRYVKK